MDIEVIMVIDVTVNNGYNGYSGYNSYVMKVWSRRMRVYVC